MGESKARNLHDVVTDRGHFTRLSRHLPIVPPFGDEWVALNVVRIYITRPGPVEYRQTSELGSSSRPATLLGDCPWAGCDTLNVRNYSASSR